MIISDYVKKTIIDIHLRQLSDNIRRSLLFLDKLQLCLWQSKQLWQELQKSSILKHNNANIGIPHQNIFFILQAKKYEFGITQQSWETWVYIPHLCLQTQCLIQVDLLQLIEPLVNIHSSCPYPKGQYTQYQDLFNPGGLNLLNYDRKELVHKACNRL